MKNVFIISIYLLICPYSFCQQLNWVKEHSLVDEGNHWGNTVSSDKNNNIYSSTLFRGTFTTQNRSGSRIRKYAQNGELKWEVYKTGEVYGLATDTNGNSYITGAFSYNVDFGCGVLIDSSYFRTMFLAKLDSNGNCLWSKMVENAYGSKIAMDKSGQSIYIIGGNSFLGTDFGCPSPQNQGFHFISKYDSDGNCLWLQPTLTWRYISSLAVNGKYIAVTGQFDQITYFGMDSVYSIGKKKPGYFNNAYTALYDLEGNLKWAKATVEPLYDAETNSIALDSANNVYVTGQTDLTGKIGGRSYEINDWHDIFLVKYNEYGDTMFTTFWPGTSSEEGRAIYANKNGIYFSGICYSQLTIGDTTINPGKVTIVLAKMSFDLKKTEWLKTFGSSGGGHSEIFQITSDTEDNIIVSGDYTRDLQVDSLLLTYNNSYYKKPFVMSIKELDPVMASHPTLPDMSNQLTVYPNPTAGIFQINYSSTEKTNLQLNVIDAKGEKVYEENISQFKGEYKKEIDLSKQAKGIYFIEIIADKKKRLKRIVLN